MMKIKVLIKSFVADGHWDRAELTIIDFIYYECCHLSCDARELKFE